MGGLLNKTPTNENIVTQSQTEEESSSPKAVVAASPSQQEQQQHHNNSKAAADDCCLVSPAATNTQEEKDESTTTTTTTTSRNLGIFLQPPTIDQMWPFLQEKGGWTRDDGSTYSCDGVVVAVCGGGNNNGHNNRGVLQYMLQNGIPHAAKYSPTELDMIERAVRSFHVPQNKDLLRAAMAVNNKKEIWPILHHKMGGKEMSDGSFQFPNNNNKTLLFSSLEEVRVHVREHGIFCQGANLTDEEKLFVLVWGSTSTEPLRTYSPPQRRSGSSSSSKVGESSAETSQEPETPRPEQGDFGDDSASNSSKPAFNKPIETAKNDEDDDSDDHEDSDDEEIDKILAMERELGQRNGRIAILKTQLSAEKAKLKRTKAQIRKSLDGRLSEAGSNIDHLETSKKRCLSKLSVLARVNCG